MSRKIRPWVLVAGLIVAAPIVGRAAPKKATDAPRDDGKSVPESSLDPAWLYYSRVAAKGQLPTMMSAPRPLVARPAPTVKIERPTARQHFATHDTEVEEPCGKNAKCLLDPRDREIMVSVKDWPMTPTGNGIAIVVDSRYGVVVHDVSKPIRMDSFVPFPDFSKKENSSMNVPMAACGWHFVAAFAVDERGFGVKAPSAIDVTAFFASSEYPDENDDELPNGLNGTVVVNVPLLFQDPVSATFYGRIAPDPLWVDYYVYKAPAEGQTNIILTHTNSTEASAYPTLRESSGGLYTIKNLGDGENVLSIEVSARDESTGFSHAGFVLVAHPDIVCNQGKCREAPKPPPVPITRWPTYSPKLSVSAHFDMCENKWLNSPQLRKQIHREWCRENRSSPKCADVR